MDMASTRTRFLGEQRADLGGEMQSTDSKVIDAFLDAVLHATIPTCSAWAPDAVLDATTPGWRFRMNGPAEIRAEYAKWFADPGEFKEFRRMPLPGGEMVQYLLAWTEDGVPHVAQHMHVFEVADGLIHKDTVMCGGRWPAPLIAEMHSSQEEHDAKQERSDYAGT